MLGLLLDSTIINQVGWNGGDLFPNKGVCLMVLEWGKNLSDRCNKKDRKLSEKQTSRKD